MNVSYQDICPELKRIGKRETNNKNMQPWYRNGVWLDKMYHAGYEMLEKRRKAMNTNTKSNMY